MIAPVAAPVARDSAVLIPAALEMPAAAAPPTVPKSAAFSPGVMFEQPLKAIPAEAPAAAKVRRQRFMKPFCSDPAIGAQGRIGKKRKKNEISCVRNRKG